jgi:thiol:disulfide interchange protein DsbD
MTRRIALFRHSKLLSATVIRISTIALAALCCGASASLGALPVPDVPDSALGTSAIFEGRPQVSARLLIESDSIATDVPFRIGVLFEMQPGWHIYWRNPGDTALPTRIVWQVEDATVGALQWPAPRVFREAAADATTYGYADQVLLSNRITIHSRVDGPVRLGAEIHFLVCREVCIPGAIALERSLTLGSPRVRNAEVQALFDAYDARVPRSASALDLDVQTLLSQSAVRPGDSFLFGVGIRSCPVTRDCDRSALQAIDPATVFLPYSQDNPSLRPLGVQEFPGAAGGFLLAMRGHTELDAPPRSEDPLRGILALADGRYVEVELPLPVAEVGTEIELMATDWLDPNVLVRLPKLSISLVSALLLALLGGLILNLMPCVLPILAIKVVALSEIAQQGRKQVYAHGFAYGAGIQASMALLTVFVLGLRQAGISVGWGFQFREPVFLAAVAVLVVLFACNLFGLFEINLNTSRVDQIGRELSGPRRSFFDGFLAVALATPCSAPFLGTAVGFAFAGGPLEIASVFAGIGLGLALPFVAVSLVPGLSQFIPSAGSWMNRMRTGLGLVLLATGVWLLWILGRVAGLEGQLAVLVLLLAVGLGAYGLGRLQLSSSPRPLGRVVATFAALIVMLLAVLPLQPIKANLREVSDGAIPWRAFDSSAITEALRARRPVFVYFTADWCITCKVNERLVLQDETVLDALKRLDVATFRGDWTLRDEAIRLELARHGKAGVPVYLVYGPDRPEDPIVLPELITTDAIVHALERATPRRLPTEP